MSQISTCVECNAPYNGYHMSLKCGACRISDAYRDSANNGRETFQQLRREMEKNEHRIREEAAESEHRIRSMFEYQTERLIAEQQKTQRLLQEQHVTPQMAYDYGYNIFKNVNDVIDFDLDKRVSKFRFTTDKYLTEILQAEYCRGYLNRFNEFNNSISEYDIAYNCYSAGTKGWSGFVLNNISVDSCPVNAEWTCNLQSKINDDGYISYYITDEAKLNSKFVSEYKRGLAEFAALQNTEELKNQRVRDRKRIEAENLAKKQRIRSENEILAKQRALKETKDKINRVFSIICGITIISFCLYLLFHFVSANSYAILSFFDPAITATIIVCLIIGVGSFLESGIVGAIFLPIIAYVPTWVLIKAFFFP